jgi:hypothetical protein
VNLSRRKSWDLQLVFCFSRQIKHCDEPFEIVILESLAAGVVTRIEVCVCLSWGSFMLCFLSWGYYMTAPHSFIVMFYIPPNPWTLSVLIIVDIYFSLLQSLHTNSVCLYNASTSLLWFLKRITTKLEMLWRFLCCSLNIEMFVCPENTIALFRFLKL